MTIKTSDIQSVRQYIKRLYFPSINSHKGQNGRVLIIGGSSLFHSASIWAAEVASHLVDIVHYSSTSENNKIFLSLKKKFRNGIVIPQKDLPNYIEEDEAILIGPGMVRGKNIKSKGSESKNFDQIIRMKNEAAYTYNLTKFLINRYPDKKFVFDGGALQMMERQWLLKLKVKPIITPHQSEFNQLFNFPVKEKSETEKIEIVRETAKKYHCVILLKAVVDIISDGNKVLVVRGGNAGLTKGGSGDVLAGLALAFYAKNDPLTAAAVASYLLKRTSDELFSLYGYWYNIDNLINNIFLTFKKITDN